MIIVLPPSETKKTGTHPTPVDCDALWQGPALRDARMRTVEALMEASARPDALQVLGVGAQVAHTVGANVDILSAPTSPACDIYSGVLYDAMDLGSWDDKLRDTASNSVFVQSALWGLVSFGDMIPAYRLSMDTDLPGIGKLAAHWKKELGALMDDMCAGQLVLDCRSGAYQKAWKPTAARRAQLAVDIVDVKAVRRDRRGAWKTVSHWAKFYRGRIAAHLVAAGTDAIGDIDDLVDVLNSWNDDELEGFAIDMEPVPTVTLMVKNAS